MAENLVPTVSAKNRLPGQVNKQEEATKVLVDNKSAIEISENPVCFSKTKHMKIKFYALQEAQQHKEVKLVHCLSEYQLADILTKALPKGRFEFLRLKLAQKCCCKVGVLPISYMGIPLGADPRRRSKNLSFTGSVVLINSVLSSLPSYYLSLFEIPKTVLLKIEKIRGQFLWGYTKDSKQLVRVSWSRVYLPRVKGGAGVVNLQAKKTNLYLQSGAGGWQPKDLPSRGNLSRLSMVLPLYVLI
ncbi:hypothetical protein GQ457_14G020860 [Hibiscus cannabinus]